MNELADIITSIVGVQMNKVHIAGSQSIWRANSDNTRLKEELRWEPQISLEEGLRRTYVWVEKQVRESASEYSFGIASFPVRPRSKEP